MLGWTRERKESVAGPFGFGAVLGLMLSLSSSSLLRVDDVGRRNKRKGGIRKGGLSCRVISQAGVSDEGMEERRELDAGCREVGKVGRETELTGFCRGTF
ncbi:unnamed protein product [Ectocarpus sp. 4 AP-2014]